MNDNDNLELNLEIPQLETIGLKNPIAMPGGKEFVHDTTRLLYDPYLEKGELSRGGTEQIQSFEVAGPREFMAFDPAQTKIAIVTCGGLCPGINSVIRALVLQARERYGIRSIVGGRFGYHGLGRQRQNFVELSLSNVDQIHELGGTILGTSRGTPPAKDIVDCLVEEKISILFAVGGDGTMRGARSIQLEIEKRKLKIAVIGVPKTIDNDIPFVRKSFGFETAAEVACQALHAAYVEAQSFDRCIGLVRLMGRHSGYIAATATLASGNVNYCLVPEIDFDLEGPGGLYETLEKRLAEKRMAVIVVAEGAGQKYFQNLQGSTDPSGNQLLGNIGEYLKNSITNYFSSKKQAVTIKYIDPSYMIRSAIANPADQLLCARFAQMAMHAAMAGKTGMMVGYWHGRMTHVPLCALDGKTQRIKEQGDLWFNVLETTGQPARMSP